MGTVKVTSSGSSSTERLSFLLVFFWCRVSAMFPNTAQAFGVAPKSAPATASRCVWALRMCTATRMPVCTDFLVDGRQGFRCVVWTHLWPGPTLPGLPHPWRPHDSREAFLSPLTIYNLFRRSWQHKNWIPWAPDNKENKRANLSAISFHFISIFRDCLSTGRSSLLRK